MASRALFQHWFEVSGGIGATALDKNWKAVTHLHNGLIVHLQERRFKVKIVNYDIVVGQNVRGQQTRIVSDAVREVPKVGVGMLGCPHDAMRENCMVPDDLVR